MHKNKLQLRSIQYYKSTATEVVHRKKVRIFYNLKTVISSSLSQKVCLCCDVHKIQIRQPIHVHVHKSHVYAAAVLRTPTQMI